MIDLACLITAILFFIGNLLQFITALRFNKDREFNVEEWEGLDPTFLKKVWNDRLNDAPLTDATGFVRALAWFGLCLPIVQVSWILSHSGQRKIALHSLMVVSVVGGSITELVSRLMLVGLDGVSYWISKDFDLDQWMGGEGDVKDNLGWKVLEISHLLSRGLMDWIDAFEWLALSFILISIYFSLRTQTNTQYTFGRKWSLLGLFMGVLCLFDFFSNALRYTMSPAVFVVGGITTALNTLILLPLWLLILGVQMKNVRDHFEGGGYENSEVQGLAGNNDSSKFVNETELT